MFQIAVGSQPGSAALDLGWVDVFHFATGPDQTSISAGTGNDVTYAVTAAIAALPAKGGVLYFRPGRYVTSGGFTISKNCWVLGCGQNYYGAATDYITQVEDSIGNNVLFTVTADFCQFENITLVCTATASSGSSAVLVNTNAVSQPLTFLAQCNYDRVTTQGFYDAVDVRVATQWTAHQCNFIRFAHWGMRLQNTINNDAGDWYVDGCFFSCAAGAAAAIRYESGGGGKITNNKILNDSGHFTNGISIDTSGATASGQIKIEGNIIEQCTGAPISINFTGWNTLDIYGNVLICSFVTANSAIEITNGSIINISGNIYLNGAIGQSAIKITGSLNYSTGPDTWSGFGSYISTNTPTQYGGYMSLATANFNGFQGGTVKIAWTAASGTNNLQFAGITTDGIWGFGYNSNPAAFGTSLFGFHDNVSAGAGGVDFYGNVCYSLNIFNAPSGGSTTLNNNDSLCLINIGGDSTTFTINMPPSPKDGQTIIFISGKVVVNLTINGNGNAVNKPPTSCLGGEMFIATFRAGGAGWFFGQSAIYYQPQAGAANGSAPFVQYAYNSLGTNFLTFVNWSGSTWGFSFNPTSISTTGTKLLTMTDSSNTNGATVQVGAGGTAKAALLVVPCTISQLPASPLDGMRLFVTDNNTAAATAGFGAAVGAGGGTNHTPVWYDGGTSTWRLG